MKFCHESLGPTVRRPGVGEEGGTLRIDRAIRLQHHKGSSAASLVYIIVIFTKADEDCSYNWNI